MKAQRYSCRRIEKGLVAIQLRQHVSESTCFYAAKYTAHSHSHPHDCGADVVSGACSVRTFEAVEVDVAEALHAVAEARALTVQRLALAPRHLPAAYRRRNGA